MTAGEIQDGQTPAPGQWGWSGLKGCGTGEARVPGPSSNSTVTSAWEPGPLRPYQHLSDGAKDLCPAFLPEQLKGAHRDRKVSGHVQEGALGRVPGWSLSYSLWHLAYRLAHDRRQSVSAT